jgi:hypothetical protein
MFIVAPYLNLFPKNKFILRKVILLSWSLLFSVLSFWTDVKGMEIKTKGKKST